ncbi:SGNH/GDSL hydrolase family protein [Cellulomonas bogoriensis]|uniref:SGNH hydrolase-type esterase domain-containing protein n=1 Tax=Cellulomonas bogoriensis 69B4 = DSM 16987 TaxID=1386082 RepID=A0A0A0BQ73_9CELL|nr:SGNH/GDSL hydrolase family protein [Cellulomonas bogoriensis]KGM09782.1 hypothetical protein N869_06055 [Cellulomonas bogoriensis 69B4 = DSM 16987]
MAPQRSRSTRRIRPVHGVTIVVVALAGLAIWLIASPRIADAPPDPPPGADAPTDTRTDPIPEAQDTTPRIAFLGDSLTVGVGAPQERGFAWQTAELLDWPLAVVDGVSGSGYVAPGLGSPMPDRAGNVIDAEPDVVVVAGGNNDIFQGVGAEQVEPAADQLFTDLREGLPDATLVVVGPFPTSLAGLETTDPVLDAVRRVSADADAHFVDPRDLLAGPLAELETWDPYISPDGLHPNEGGYQLIAEALAGALPELTTNELTTR